MPAIALRQAAEQHTLLKSLETEGQLFGVLDRPYLAALIDKEARGWVVHLIAKAESIEIVERVTACRDPTDDRFLEVAVNGSADLILTGDKDLLILHPFRGIRILAPAQFVHGTAAQP